VLGLGLDLFSVWCESTREIAKVVDRIGGVLKSRGSAVDVSCMSKEKKTASSNLSDTWRRKFGMCVMLVGIVIGLAWSTRSRTYRSMTTSRC